MKSRLFGIIISAGLALQTQAATINWSAGVDNGFSLENGSSAPVGSLVRVGWFRDSGTGIQLTDAEIQTHAANPAVLDTHFVEVANTTIGSGFTPAIAAHFSANSAANTGNGGLAVAGRQMYLWVLNGTLGTATQQAILYWDATDLATNPDSSPQPPGVRWVFPGEEPVPGVTTIDLTDLTSGTSTLAAGAKVLVGAFPVGTSAETGAPNFGMETIDAPLAIVTAAALPGGVVNAAYSTTLVATGGRSPLEWDVTGGTLPTGVSLATNGTLSGTPTSAGAFSFTATVTDDIGEDESRLFTLVVASTAVSITTANTLPGGFAGANYTQALTGSGGTAPYSFALTGGTLPGTVSLASGGALSGMLGATGTFNFDIEMTDSGGLSVSKSFSIVVSPSPAITSPAILPQGVVGSAYSFTFGVLGGGTYTWTFSGGALPANLTLATNGQLTGSPTTAGTSNFTVSAQGPTGNISTKSFTLVVNASLVSPTMDDPAFPVTAVSALFNHTITASPSPSGYSASGLPAGLKLNATTGAITGRPTASGLFMVKLKAKNGRGFGPELIAPLVVQALPTGAVGVFVGMVDRNGTVNSGLGGRLDLTTTITGSYTLKLTQGATTTSVKGVLNVVPGSEPTLTSTVGGAVVDLTFDSDESSVDGDATVGMDSAIITGWRNVWNKVSNPASALVGYYSFGMDLTTDIGTATVPQGTGFASFTVAADGKLTVKGKAADGSAVTTAGFVGKDGSVLVYQQLYSKLGSLLGVLTMTADPDGNFTENEISGQLVWSKPATTGKLYPAQFGPLVLDAEGKYLARAATGSIVLGLPSTSTTAELDFSEGGLALAALNPDVPAFTYTSKFLAVIPPAHPTKTTLKIASATGVVSGNFTLQDGAVKRVVPFSGITIRNSDGSTRAGGYFLAPQLGLPASTLSGKVHISQ